MYKFILKAFFCFFTILIINSNYTTVHANDSVDFSSKVYRVGLPQVPGLMWRSSAGQVKGFPLEIFEQIAKDENISFEWIEAPWPKLYDLILKGELDVLPGTQITEERKKHLDFLENSLYTMWSELFISKQNDFTDLSVLSGKRIGIVKGDNNGLGFEKYIQTFDISYQKVELESHAEGVHLLKEGDIFAMAAPSFYLKSGQHKGVKHAGLYFNPTELSFSFPKNTNPELCTAIENRMAIYKEDANSIYNQLFLKYGLANYNTSPSTIPGWLRWVLLLSLVAAVVSIVFVLVLRKQVLVKTRSSKTREIYLRRAMELGKMGTWQIDLSNWTMVWSNELYEFLGYSHKKELSFKFMREMIFKEDQIRLTQVFFDSIRLHKNFDIEFRLRKSDGSVVYTRQMGVLYADEQGKTSHVFGIMQNITQQKQNAELLIKAKDKAEESERLKSVFLANMSHEIRTPLNAIIGFSTLIAKNELDKAKQDNFLNIIEKQNGLLLSLINDIIDFAKIESRSLNIIMTDNVELSTLINDVFEAFKPHITEDVGFRIVENKFGNHVKLRTDAIRLKQMISNLVINAFKYTEEGFVELGYRTNSITEKLEIFVNDSGIGISDEHHRKVFERFHQVNELSQGTGLGLAICKSLAQMLGGDVILNKSTKEGSEFIIELPFSCIQSSDEDIYKAVLLEEEVDIDSIKYDGINVLIAEDIDSNYLYLRTVLENRNMVCARAKDGVEVVDMAMEGIYDLILMDIKMPQQNGLIATSEIRKTNSNIPIIAVTAHAFDADRAKAIEAGCTDYISKPVNREELLELMATALHLVD